MRQSILIILLLVGFCEVKASPKRFFSEISAGYGFSQLPESLGDIYESNTSIAFSMGYMINRYFGIIPLSFSSQDFSFNRTEMEGLMAKQWHDSIIRAFEANPGAYIEFIELDNFTAASSLRSVSYTPGLSLKLPISDRISWISRGGIGLFRESIRLYARVNELDRHLVRAMHQAYYHKTKKHFGLNAYSGVEFRINSLFSVMVQGGGEMIFKYKTLLRPPNLHVSSDGFNPAIGLGINKLKPVEDKDGGWWGLRTGTRIYF